MQQIKIPHGMQTIAISKLIPNPKNVKIHTKQQLEGLAEVIKLLGIFKDPVVIDKKNIIWIGHGRLEAAKILGMKQVPYILSDHLSLKDRKALMILDNKIAESAWNKEAMAELLMEIPEYNFQPFNVELEEYRSIEPIQDIPPEPRQSTDIKRGNLYQLGNHRLLCGDCTMPEDVSLLLGDRKVEQLNTDPPYGVDYGAKNRFLNGVWPADRIEEPILGDNIKNYPEFYNNFLDKIPFAEKNTIYITISGQKLLSLSQTLLDNNIKISQYLIWKKNNHVLGRQDYANIHELIIYGWKGTHLFYGNFGTTVLEYDRPNNSDLHPTMKPIALLVRLITDGSTECMLIYDPFLGSGSTLIACEQTNRICYGMEIDPIYCQVIIDRWEQFTGKKAKLILQPSVSNST